MTDRCLVNFEVSGAIATIVLNDPPMNLVSLELTAQLEAALDAIELDPAIRAVIITGAGDRAFCTGSDINEFARFREPGVVLDKKLKRQNAVFNRLARLDRPTVAAVNGLALGGGLEIALCCDFIVAEERSRLGLPEIRLGVFPSSGGPLRAARRIGEGRARQLILLGEPIGAYTALTWGLIDRIAANGEVRAEATELARSLGARAPLAYAMAKRAIALAFDAPFDDALARALTFSDRVFSSPQSAEGVRAFLAKETPDFSAFAPESRERDSSARALQRAFDRMDRGDPA